MSSSSNILCIDSSTEACSVALLTANDTLHQEFMLAPREHTQKILPTVNEVVKRAGLTLSNIDLIAYGQGPGSFTGVRIGISIAQGLAFGLDKKMVGISTLQAMAQEALASNQSQNVYAAIDARMGEVYFAHYQNVNGTMQLQDREVVIKPEELIALFNSENNKPNNKSVLVGTGWSAYSELLHYFKDCVQLNILYPNAAFMLQAAQAKIVSNDIVLPEDATPVYLRDTVTWKKLPGRE